MRKTISILLVLCCSITFLSCDYKAKNKISKEEYANDIGKYVTINESVDQDVVADDKGGYLYEEEHNGYILYNNTEYTMDKVIIEFSLEEQVHKRPYMTDYEYYTVLLEFNYIKAKENKTITKRDVVKALNPNINEYSFSVKSFNIKEIKSTALGIL